MTIDRRRVLTGLATGSAWCLVPRLSWRDARAAAADAGTDYPFRLGVASGYPTDRSVMLWTHVAPPPASPRAALLATVDIPLRFEVASDAGFRTIEARGAAAGAAQHGHSVHAEVQGLRPARDYWYRFIAGDHVSAVGRTRTLPAARDSVRSMRIAVASCQHWETAHFAAWRHAAASAPDLILHLGDYIYEGAPGSPNGVRRHTGRRCINLADYRERYAQYQADASLQAAHAAAPWFVTWDDHEFNNNYSGDTPGRPDNTVVFAERRAAAYQAWFEHMPVPPSMAPVNGRVRIHSRASLGALASVHMLDQRQYRSPQACPRPAQFGGLRLGDDCTERLDPARTMLGAQQEQWLSDGLAALPARWTLLAQGTVFSHLDQGSGGTAEYWSDGWSGYPGARQRLVDSLRATRSGNPVILSGDIHAFCVAGVHAVPERPQGPLVAAELVATSISSDPIVQSNLDLWRSNNPHVHRFDGRGRGYLALTLTEASLKADLVTVDDPARADSPCRISAAHVVEAGDLRIHDA